MRLKFADCTCGTFVGFESLSFVICIACFYFYHTLFWFCGLIITYWWFDAFKFADWTYGTLVGFESLSFGNCDLDDWQFNVESAVLVYVMHCLRLLIVILEINLICSMDKRNTCYKSMFEIVLWVEVGGFPRTRALRCTVAYSPSVFGVC